MTDIEKMLLAYGRKIANYENAAGEHAAIVAEFKAKDARIRELEPDANRYLWLKTVAPMELTVFAWRSRAATRFDTPDEAIDAAIQERAAREGK